MTDAELDANIESTRITMEEHRTKAEAALDAFLVAAGEQLKAWLPRRVQTWVEDQHVVTKAMPLEKLRDLKQETERCAQELPAKVREWLGSDQLWRHRAGYKQPDPKAYYQSGDYTGVGRSGPKRIAEPLDNALSFYVTTLARKYGYQDVHHIGADWDGTLNTLIKAYAEAYEVFSRASSRHDTALDAKERKQAQDLWNKV